jgi:ABC-type transporter Mla subunit MlaD
MADTAGWKDLRIGIAAVVTLAVIALCVLLFARVGALRGEKFRLFLRVSTARGLMKGSEVWLGGQRAGQVTNIRFLPPAGNHEDPLLVEMEVLERYRQSIRRDSPAQIRAGGRLIAAPVVAIGAGTSRSPVVTEGDTIRARPQGDIESVAGRFGEATRDFPAIATDVKRVGEQMRSPRGTIGALGGERAALELKAARERSSRIAASVSRGRGSLGRLFSSREALRHRARTVLARADSVQGLLTSPDYALGRFRRDTTLRASVAEIQRELAVVRTLLSEARGTAGRIERDQAIMEALAEAEREMAAVMADMRRRPLRYLNF